MRQLTFGIDNRALRDGDEGHSKLWNQRMGQVIERLDVLVECRSDENYREKQIAPNVRVIPVHTRFRILYPLAALRVALREHKRHRYQLVSSEDPFRPGLGAYLFRILTGVPLCVEYHTECFHNPSWLNERPLLHRIYHLIGKQVVRAAEGVRCVNKRNYEQLRQISLRDPGKPIAIIPVPTLFYDPLRNDEGARRLRRELLPDPGAVLVLFVGRLVRGKRVDQLLQVFAHVGQRHPEAHLCIIGGGPEHASLLELSRKLGLQRVTFKDHLPEAEVFDYYGAADLLVNPSRNESYGRIYIEAMSAGKPVISTVHSGAVDDGLVEHGVTGLVFDPDQEGGLEQALERMVADVPARRRMGEAALARVREKHDYGLRIEQMRQLWETTAARGKKRQ